jgi:hypothetical protein
MVIKWTFAFDEGSLAVEVRDEKEDERIGQCVDASLDWINIPTVGKDAFINLRMCKAIIREEINEQAQTTETAQAPEAPSNASGTAND